MLNGELGYGGGYQNTPALPFFKNFYMGGVNSLRGFRVFSVGPKDIQGNPRGGSHKMLGNAEFFFPMPGLQGEKSVRMSAFADAGMVGGNFAPSDLRYSLGLGVLWVSPMGPLKISLGIPLKAQTGDHKQVLQFTFGGAF
jgi:outer membrane protein insertion porin family